MRKKTKLLKRQLISVSCLNHEAMGAYILHLQVRDVTEQVEKIQVGSLGP